MYADLKKLISTKKLCANTVHSLAFQMIEGLAYLHSRKIIHGDLKPGNIVINWRSQLKICNFGSAINAETDNRKWSKTYLDQADEIISLRYSAPEVTTKQKVIGAHWIYFKTLVMSNIIKSLFEQ